MAILHILRCLLIYNRREPVSFYYNLVFPLLFFVGLVYWKQNEIIGMETAIEALIAVSAYSIYTTTFYGVGLVLAYWRESGLFLSLCHSRGALYRMFFAQALLRSLFAALFTALFILTAFFQFGEYDLQLLWRMPVASFLLGMLCGLASSLLLVVRISPGDLNTCIGITVFLFLYLSHLGMEYGAYWLQALNLLNPIYLNQLLLTWAVLGSDAQPVVLDIIVRMLFFTAIGVAGLSFCRRQPVLSRL